MTRSLVPFLLLVIAGPVIATDWSVEADLDDQLFPSLIVSAATMVLDETDREPNQLGSIRVTDIYGAFVIAPTDNATVKVTVASEGILKPSVFEGRLPTKGTTYQINPALKWNFDALYANRNPRPVNVEVAVEVNGEKLGEKVEVVTLRAITDVLFGYVDDDTKDHEDLSLFFAAYVDENNPNIDVVLKKALDVQKQSGDEPQFAGYQGNAIRVEREVRSIWYALKELGFRYSSIATPSVTSEKYFSQHVRLMTDSLNGSQANCVDGSILFASILRKIGLKTGLVLAPGHMFVTGFLEENSGIPFYLETTMLGTAEFEEALQKGAETIMTGDEKTTVIDIDVARAQGIMPIADPRIAQR